MTSQERFLAVVQAATDVTVAEHVAGLEVTITRVEVNPATAVVYFTRNAIDYTMEAVPMTNHAGTHHGFGYTIKPVELSA